MERDSNQAALNLIYDWALSISPWFSGQGFDLTIHDPVGQSLQITLESKDFLIDIHALSSHYGLDILIFPANSKQPVYSVTGACENPTGFMNRLNRLLEWVKNNKG